MTISIPSCRTCVLYISAGQCLAFPKGIPAEIWFGENDHHNPYPGDHDIQFKSFHADTKGQFVTIDDRVVFVGGPGQSENGEGPSLATVDPEVADITELEGPSQKARNYIVDDPLNRNWIKMLPKIRLVTGGKKTTLDTAD